MKVAMVCRDAASTIGGISTHVTFLKAELEKLGCEVQVVHGHGSALSTVMLPVGGQRAILEGCDVVHVQAPPYGPFVISLDKPFVVTVHSPLSEEMKFRHGWRKLKMKIWRRMEARTLKHADAVIAVSNFTKGCLIQKSECDPDKITVIPNGVDLDRFRPEKPDGWPVSMMVCSRPDARKNLPQTYAALRYFERLGKVYPALGGVCASEVEAMYRKADIFLTTSFSEGFNLTLLQGMASGCACLASDIPAHRELGADSVLYYDSDEKMRDWLDYLSQSLIERRHWGWRARMRAESYTWTGTAKQTKEIYDRILVEHDLDKRGNRWP
jgi:glycosyltransferase involved in cell wall biosynthesis